MSDPARPRFGRRGAPPAVAARVGAMGLLLVVAALMLGLKAWWMGRPSPPPAVVVEVRGDVGAPGFYPVGPPATVHLALRAAGTDPKGVADATLEPGTRLRMDQGKVLLERMDELLVFGLPIDVNQASTAALESIPGIGASKAQAIVDEREHGGPFGSVDEMVRVRGIGPATVDQLRPFVVAGGPP